MTTSTPVRHRLVRPRADVVVPALDAHQQRVVDHAAGPLLVLAGPGTGKTTTLVEAIVRRVEEGVDPEQVLALTFSRKAAEQLRDRVMARLGRTTAGGIGSTFHSFAYGLIRRYAPAELYEAPLRLLSAPEQDVVLRELLRDHPESVSWPEQLDHAIGTRGFVREVHAVLSRAREKGLDGQQLRALGEAERLPEYVAAGLFLDQYLDNLDSQGATDYADLIRRATIEADAHREELRAAYRWVFVDEYQDTDPGQVALLRVLAGDGRNLVAVGDPHQSIYAFRGADVRGILEFPTSFPRVGGAPAEAVVLRTTRRFGPALLRASQRVAGRIPLPGTIDERARELFLAPQAREDGDPGRVEVLTFDTERAEAEHLADLLRRAHLEDGIGWSEMAVLVRSGRTTIPGLRRSLAAAGVPVEVASDDTPLVAEPAVRTLVDALEAVLHLDTTDPQADGYVDATRAHAMLQSPLAGLDAADVRVLARRLRAREKAVAEADGRTPRSSPELLRAALLDATVFDDLDDADDPGVRRAAALARLLRDVHAAVAEGASSEEALWALWSGTSWPARLQAAVERGGSGVRAAHRDLDAVVALFEEAARVEDRRGHTGLESFLATLVAQQIPADTLADQGIRGEAVRMLTAHRSKGLEWRLVVVAHVQEEGWPDLRRRATLLQADRIGSDGLVPPTTSRELLADERRLFYVACTRARERLVVTAVASSDDEGEQASRFVGELGVTVDHRAGRPRRPLSLPGLVAELRRTVADDGMPLTLRRAAAHRLARLVVEHREGRAWVPAADPATWWGTRGWSSAPAPLRPADEPVRLTASALTSLEQCPAKWFLESEAGGERASTQAQGFGNVVHALADRIAREELAGEAAEPDVERLMTHVDEVWEQIPFRTPWSSAREREEVRRALARFLAWHGRPDARQVLATEQPIRAEVPLPGGQVVALHGYADRLELDADGRVVVIDLKTSKYFPTNDEIAVHPQLGLYQLAVEHGAVDDLVPGAQPGGAELWQLRHDLRAKLRVQQQPPQEPDEEGLRPIERQLVAAVEAVREERFPARPGGHCDHCDFVSLCPAKHSGTVLS
ncbi:ATP-dependent DNA helicase [Nocardioides sp. SYSU D00038]|uniref:ATP-dependent helicase n=1 Tax=Nocardioides sp. SYSU D00038 TaxID=2812554 RepID=UPI001967F9A0|nr:ATP-dependent DNA helicase [Nocardioides sp. SYSU D00038]